MNHERFDIWKNELKAKEPYLLRLQTTDNGMLRQIQQLLEQMILFAETNNVTLSLVEYRQLYLHKADIHLHFNEYAEAIRNYEKVKSKIDRDDDDTELHWLKSMEGISWAKARLERYKEALKDCDELIAHAWRKKILIPKFFIVRACCYKESGNEILAERDFEIAQKPMHLHLILSEEGDEALGGYTAMGYNALGNRFFKHQLFEYALRMYEEAIRLKSDYALAYYNKGVVYTQMNYRDSAIKAFTQCIQYDPRNAGAYLNRGNAYCNVMLFDLALQDYEMCLRLNPGNQSARDNINYIRNNFFSH